MDPRAVVALAVVLGDELPVRVDLVGNLVGDPQRREVEPLEVRDEVAQPVDQLGRLGLEADEDEALPGRQADRDQAEAVEAEVVEVLGVLGPDERAVEVVDPGVVRALEADGLAAALLDDRGPAVLADVVEPAQDLVATADDHERLVVDRGQEVGPRRPGVLLATRPRPSRDGTIRRRSNSWMAGSW